LYLPIGLSPDLILGLWRAR